MKNILKITSLFSMVWILLLTSCDSGFEDVNTDPNNPTEISEDLQLGFIERTLINRLYDYFAAGENASTWPQHLSQPIYNDSDRYLPRQGSIGNLWNVLYADVIAEADEMYRLSEEAENRAAQGVALTLKAIAAQTLTDAFGNVPLSETNQGADGNFTPSYDTQEEVYIQIFEMLDEALVHLNSGEGSVSSSQDLIYAGDIDMWIKFATSVKFRAMMRISDTPLFNAGELQALADSGELITSTQDNAYISFETENSPNANPYYGIVQNSRQREWAVGKSLVDFLENSGDPRLEVYAKPIEDGSYRGKPAGYINPAINGFGVGTVSEIGDAFMAYDAPLYFVTASQINLLLAEAAQKGYISGDAETYFNSGVAASLEQNGIDPTSYTVTYSGYQSIAEQLWVSTFLQGYETWAEWRRSDIPVLPLAIEPAPGVNSIPTRYNYTNDERALNGSNVDAASADQGEDALTTKIWWDVN